jgi:hypothetical protein
VFGVQMLLNVPPPPLVTQMLGYWAPQRPAADGPGALEAV